MIFKKKKQLSLFWYYSLTGVPDRNKFASSGIDPGYLVAGLLICKVCPSPWRCIAKLKSLGF